MSASKFYPNPQFIHGKWRLKAWDYINLKNKYLGTFDTKAECVDMFNSFLSKQVIDGAKLPIPKGINISIVNNKPRYLLQLRIGKTRKTVYSSYYLTDVLNVRRNILSQLIDL